MAVSMELSSCVSSPVAPLTRRPFSITNRVSVSISVSKGLLSLIFAGYQSSCLLSWTRCSLALLRSWVAAVFQGEAVFGCVAGQNLLRCFWDHVIWVLRITEPQAGSMAPLGCRKGAWDRTTVEQLLLFWSPPSTEISSVQIKLHILTVHQTDHNAKLSLAVFVEMAFL